MGGDFPHDDDEDDDDDDKDDMDLDDKCKVSYRSGQMEIDECYPQGRFLDNNKLVNNIGKVVRDLRSLGFTSMTEDAYASAIFLFLKVIIISAVGFSILLYVKHPTISFVLPTSNLSCLNGRPKFMILLVMITGFLFWSPSRGGFRWLSYACISFPFLWRTVKPQITHKWFSYPIQLYVFKGQSFPNI